jgi:hypothetical protein
MSVDAQGYVYEAHPSGTYRRLDHEPPHPYESGVVVSGQIRAIAPAPGGDVFLVKTDGGSTVVQRYNADGATVGSPFGGGVLQSPSDAALDPRNSDLLVCDEVNNRMDRFDGSGSYLGQVTIPGGFSGPRHCSVGSDGTVFVMDELPTTCSFGAVARVNEIAPDGTLVRQGLVSGSDPGSGFPGCDPGLQGVTSGQFFVNGNYYRVDTAPPAIDSFSTCCGWSRDRSYSLVSSDPIGSTLYEEFSLDGGPFTPAGFLGYSIPTDGHHMITARVTDSPGHSAERSEQVDIDGTKPTLKLAVAALNRHGPSRPRLVAEARDRVSGVAHVRFSVIWFRAGKCAFWYGRRQRFQKPVPARYCTTSGEPLSNRIGFAAKAAGGHQWAFKPKQHWPAGRYKFSAVALDVARNATFTVKAFQIH